jgi:hypothetical protein
MEIRFCELPKRKSKVKLTKAKESGKKYSQCLDINHKMVKVGETQTCKGSKAGKENHALHFLESLPMKSRTVDLQRVAHQKAMSLRRLLFDPTKTFQVGCLLILVELFLSFLIIQKVPCE